MPTSLKTYSKFQIRILAVSFHLATSRNHPVQFRFEILDIIVINWSFRLWLLWCKYAFANLPNFLFNPTCMDH